MASTLVAERKFAAAIHYIEIGLQLDPFSEINHHLRGFIAYAQEQYEEAIQWFEKASVLKPSFIVAKHYKGQALLLLGRAKEALTLFEQLPEDTTGDFTRLGFVTLAHAVLGKKQHIQTSIKQLEKVLETPAAGKAVSALMLIYTMLGQSKKALQIITKGIGLKVPMLIYIYNEPLLKPLYPIPQFQTLVKKILGAKTTFDFNKRKYKKALFTKTELVTYRQQLLNLMQKKKPYINANLTLRDLAQQIKLPANQLSQLLNEGFDKNFSEFVNSYRLEVFKSKIANPANRHYTILGLAYESGFNSKTVFNAFFKKKEGKTPRAYQKELIRQ